MGAMQQILQGSSGIDHDPFFSSVVLLLHMDDTNPNDFSNSAHSCSKIGTSRSSTESKFGGFSFVFSGSTSYISYANHADYNFGTGDFTAELWFFPTAADFGMLVESGNSPFTGTGSIAIAFNANRTVQIGNANGASAIVVGTALLSLNAWHHIVAQRSGTTWTQYIDGVSDGTATSAVNLTATGPMTIGGTSRLAADSCTGYIDELRLTKGVARYSGASFAVPTAPFANA
jgi:hypothetical protein